MITLINSPSIYSCFLKSRKIWINLADIRVIEETQTESTTVLTITWRHGNCDVIGGEDAITILEEWKAASAKLTKILEDHEYFLMDKQDLLYYQLALGLAIQEMFSLHNEQFNLQELVNSIKHKTNLAAQQVNPDYDPSELYLTRRPFSGAAKISAAILEYSNHCSGYVLRTL